MRRVFHGQTLRLLKRADKIIATSPLYIEGSPYLSRFKNKCIVIPNSINENRMRITDTIVEKVEEIKKQNHKKYICFGVGRHIPYKGFKYLVEASRYLDDRFVIFIGGRGELSNQLRDQAKGDSKVVFLGRLSDEELIAYYMSMDIFCFPSITKNEAFGIALAEGMYFGKPAVTFHINGSGVNYVNQNNVTGLEVPNCDSRAYASAIKRLAEDCSLREQMGKKARERVDLLFLTSTFQSNIREMITSL